MVLLFVFVCLSSSGITSWDWILAGKLSGCSGTLLFSLILYTHSPQSPFKYLRSVTPRHTVLQLRGEGSCMACAWLWSSNCLLDCKFLRTQKQRKWPCGQSPWIPVSPVHSYIFESRRLTEFTLLSPSLPKPNPTSTKSLLPLQKPSSLGLPPFDRICDKH